MRSEGCMKTDDFDYELPKELIAQTPLEKRDNSRLPHESVKRKRCDCEGSGPCRGRKHNSN